MVFQKGHIGYKPFLGRHHTEETKQKISEAHIGEKHGMWKGGVSSDKEYRNKYARDKLLGLRFKLLDFLGNKCARCGYSNDNRALQLDHINGGGTKERKTLGRKQMYESVFVSPEKYQLLCANCNAIKRFENNEW